MGETKEENVQAEIAYVVDKMEHIQIDQQIFTDRELKELELAITYSRHFAHGRELVIIS
jgi:hypothetical protein